MSRSRASSNVVFCLFAAIAVGGCGGSDGGSSPATLEAIEIAPHDVTLAAGSSQHFGATARFSDGSSEPATVSWSATGGTVLATGDYTAPGAPGDYFVIATASGGSPADTALVTVPAAPPPDLVAVEVTPGSATVVSGQTQQFTAVGRLSDNSTMAVPVNWTATGGSISAGGVFTAGNTPGSYRVIATEIGGAGLADTSTVTVSATLVAIEVTPPTVTLAPGATQQFSVVGRYSDNSTQPATVSWSATGGGVSSSGLYTAGATSGTYHVIATLSGGSLADTSVVTISVAGPTLLAIVIAPDSAHVHAREAATFTAVGRMSDNSTVPIAVDWTTTAPATAGTMGSNGVFTAKDPVGAWKVIATQHGGTLADTVPVVVYETAGVTISGPAFWLPVAPGGPTVGTAAVELCVGNHFTDDPAGLGATATVTASPDVGVVSPTVAYTTTAPMIYADGSGEVTVVCQKVWEAPPGLVGNVTVTISVAPNRPGSGFAKVFTYASDRVPTPPAGRADFSKEQDFTPRMTSATVAESYVVSASVGANIWFKSTRVP